MKEKRRVVTTEKNITPEVINKYISACSWGDVPDWGDAIITYLIMDGYFKIESTNRL